jgi:lysophospholipase L1-like esterase
MNKLLTMSLISMSLVALSGCNDNDRHSTQAFSGTPAENTPAVNTPVTNTPVTNTPAEVTPVTNAPITTSTCVANGNPISSFERVQLHFGLLRDQTFVTGETGGLLPLTVTADANAGSTTIHVDSTTALFTGQLITYLGENFDYYVAEIASLTSTTITLTSETAIVSKLSAGKTAWNFYNEASDANDFGHQAIADFSFRKTSTIVSPGATHVIIGDSWLNDSAYTNRLRLRYPSATVINSTGNTDTLCDLLANFNSDVATHSPQFVWISSSINDNSAGVSQEDYKLRLQDLIAKVQDIGATAIVYDAVAGSDKTTVDGALTSQVLAYRYSTQVQDLFNEAKTPVTEEEPVVTPPVVTPPPSSGIEEETPVGVSPPTVPEEVEEEEPQVGVTPPTTTGGTASCSATAEPINSFVRVQMHFGLLKGQGFVSDSNGQAETEGLVSYNVTSAASAGSTTINVASTDGLVVGQLITYLETDGIYRVAKIRSLTSTQITLEPRIDGAGNEINDSITSGISAGDNLWNFYLDPSHPNSRGARAVVDFGNAFISSSAGVNEGTHTLLGDSWFSGEGFEERVRERLPSATVINQGVGGHTLCDLLERFDRDVTPSAPNFVWINSGVNDYFHDVQQEEYRVRMQNLIAKVQSIGAVAVVFDPPPAPNGTAPSGVAFNTLSQRYATQISELLSEANATE